MYKDEERGCIFIAILPHKCITRDRRLILGQWLPLGKRKVTRWRGTQREAWLYLPFLIRGKTTATERNDCSDISCFSETLEIAQNGVFDLHVYGGVRGRVCMGYTWDARVCGP